MSKVISICLLIVGIINFLPLVGVLSAQKLESAYSISLVSNDLVILMRHRALLFGIIGGFILYSVFFETYQNAAIVMAAVSMLGFVGITLLVGGYNQSIFKVLIVDFLGIAFLFVVILLKYFGPKQ